MCERCKELEQVLKEANKKLETRGEAIIHRNKDQWVKLGTINGLRRELAKYIKHHKHAVNQWNRLEKENRGLQQQLACHQDIVDSITTLELDCDDFEDWYHKIMEKVEHFIDNQTEPYECPDCKRYREHGRLALRLYRGLPKNYWLQTVNEEIELWDSIKKLLEQFESE